jgi:hypothetical protein
MFTRRGILLASISAGITLPSRNAAAAASQPSTPVNFDVPAGATDCHTHIHGDPAKFPWFAGRVYTPEPASPEEMSALHKALHIERVASSPQASTARTTPPRCSASGRAARPRVVSP